MIILNLSAYYHIGGGENFGAGLNAYTGLHFVCGLLLGPYGALGATIGNMICDYIRGYSPNVIILSSIMTFGISYLAYVLWYEPFRKKTKIIKPRLTNTHYLIRFLSILLFTGMLYALFMKITFQLSYPRLHDNIYIFHRYFLNYINFGYLFGVAGIWISRKYNFIHTPKLSEKQMNKKLYISISVLLAIAMLIVIIIDINYKISDFQILLSETVLLLMLLYSYLTKPMHTKITPVKFTSILEKIMDAFLGISIVFIILAIVVSANTLWGYALASYLPIPNSDAFVVILLFADVISLSFIIPTFIVLKYVESNVIKPIKSFSKIKNFIKEGEKIESEGLIEIYSDYINVENEIGTLARTYTELSQHNNKYIENIHKIESEKERIKAELEIAEKIQKSNLPKNIIDKDEVTVFGYSKPAKEVGGDFYDYYEIDDEHLAIVIGDASGKGVPAALLSTITQALIKQILKTEKDPSKTLYMINNHICENNTEAMFITLWLGIYNKKNQKLIFSNAGHNPPIIYQENKFKFLDTDEGIVLGILENYEFKKEKTSITKGLLLYTDGITDANNPNDELYGEDRLIEFLNHSNLDNKIIKKLLNDIDNFSQNEDQFDDMTLLVLETHD